MIKYFFEVHQDKYGKNNYVLNFQRIIGTVAAVLLFAALSLLYWPIRQVPNGYKGFTTSGGHIVTEHNEGWVFLLPWQALHNIDLHADMSGADNAAAATLDLQTVHTSLVVRYSILPDRAREVFEKYAADGDLDNVVFTATTESFKAVTAGYTLIELIAKREEVSQKIQSVLKEKLAVFGARVLAVDVKEFTPSEIYMAAVEKKTVEEQNKLAAINRAATVREEQQAIIAEAHGKASAQKEAADGDYYARVRQAEGEAAAMKAVNDELKRSQDVLALRKIEVEKIKAERWSGALPTSIYAGAPIPFLNVNNQ